jgi:hypothetical protein
MTKLQISINGLDYEIMFVVQRRKEQNTTRKDTLCFGAVDDDRIKAVVVQIPAVAYLGAGESYNRYDGEHLALERFINRNNVVQEARPLIWKAFLAAYKPQPKIEKKTPGCCGCSKGKSGDSGKDNTVDILGEL